MGMYLLYICIGDLKHLSQKCSKQLSWQGFAVPPSEKEGKPQWESIPVLSTLLVKGTQTPLALDTERREDAKEDASTTKVKGDGSQLLLDLNIGLLFEKVSYVGYWKKKQPPKIPSETPHPRTKPLLCSSDMKIAVLRQASHRARHCKDGTQLWRQVLSRGTKNESHLFSFACEKSRKFINIMEKSQRAHHPGRLARIYTVSQNASLFLLNKYEASGKNYPVSLKGRGKNHNPGKSSSTIPTHTFRKACFQILVMLRCVPKHFGPLHSSPSVTLASTTMP